MIIENKTAEKYLKRHGHDTTYTNILILKDEVASDYDREDYNTLDDLMTDAISNLESMNRLTKSVTA